MSSRTMNVSVLVNLVDRMTAPLRRLRAGLDELAAAGRRIGLIGAAVAGISFLAPLQQAAAFDAALRDIAITAGRTGGQVEQLIASQADKYQKLALLTGQRSADIAGAAQTLVSAGMDEGLIQRLMPAIARVSTAANAQINDTAKSAFALSDALKIPAEQMELALAKLVTAGKLGRFEFKNMATEFPELTAQVAKLGVTGMEAVDFLGAALQTAMKGTNNPATAANNLKNFLSKIASPEARRNFEKELGVDVIGVMTNATAKGINPIEAVLEKLSTKLAVPQKEIDAILKKAKATGMTDKEAADALRGRLQQLLQGSKLGNIFQDMQVQDFLIPFMLNKAGFKQDKAQIQRADTGVIGDDFESRMRGLQQQLNRFTETGTQVMRRIGAAFATNLGPASDAMDRLLGIVANLDQRFPGLVDKTLSWVGALLALGVALAVLSPVFAALGAAIALVFSPAGAIALGITATIGALYLFRQEIMAAMMQAGQWAGEAASRITQAFANLATTLQQFGAKAMQSLWDGMKTVFDGIIAWADAQVARLLAVFEKLSGIGKGLGFGGAPTEGGINRAPGGGVGSPAPNIPTPGQGGFSPSPGRQSSIGGENGFAPRERVGALESRIGGRIVVQAAPGTTVREAVSDTPGLALVPDRGAVLGRA
jgi:TP901 family phage tail tape measure protein